ncbi:DUF58 domain-containing protein [Halovivax limisalsi]|uniref:DUF58 domain-containing protein n=1 Tax=Halovivax limisalsi TaxID=1453760 RepID=UPI001FFC7EF2|nr:DUF58 domain-containing protein [Halovivax limisalsi]
MRPTRRGASAYALAAVLVGYAVVVADPLALAGATLVGAWLLAAQYRFLRAARSTADGLSVRVEPGRRAVRTGATTPVALSVSAEAPLATPDVAVEVTPPTAAVADEPLSLAVDPAEPSARTTVDVEWPIAGRHRLSRPTLTLSDGLFTQRVPVGEPATVTVEPRGPRSIHVGAGGDQLASTFGEHAAGRRGSGIEAAELREYQPGDLLRQIDWKATARLATPHVREYEAETDRRTILVVDERPPLATGPPAESKLAYLREVALAVAASARRLGDPTGLVTVSEDGVRRVDSASTPDTYGRIRRTLLDLEPSDPARSTGASIAGRSDRSAPVARRRALADLGDGSAFSRTLRPFYADRPPMTAHAEGRPLFEGVTRALASEPGDAWLVCFTDDATRDELRETITYARRRGATVLVVLAPTVLYEPGGLASLDRARSRYADFEEFRSELDRIDGVTALEAGPADRLSAVLSRTTGGSSVGQRGDARPGAPAGANRSGGGRP